MVVGNLLISMLRHADRLAIGCQAQLVNIIAPIRTRAGGPAWRQTIFHPFAYTARLARGTVLQAALRGPVMTTGRFGDVPALDAIATLDEPAGRLTVFAVNRGTESVPLDLDLRAFPGLAAAAHVAVAEDDPGLINTETDPDRVVPRDLPAPHLDGGRTTVVLPPISWHALSFTLEEQP
jgi:alpha-N-arabinofuranosidase